MMDDKPRSADVIPKHIEAARRLLGTRRSNLIKAIVAGLVPAISEYVTAQVKPLRDRIAELEARPTVKYLGTWKSHETYTVGNMVTDHGSCWHCNVSATTERPGDSRDWTLAVKRGSRGRSDDDR
jgi:hypothetical protein